jgi:hypothetical protein
LFAAECTDLQPVQPPTSRDEGFKLLHENMGCIRADIENGTRNADTLNRLGVVLPLVQYALNSPIPKTDASDAEIALVGIADATSKYKSLLEASRVTLVSIKAKVTLAGAQACGPACEAYLEQIDALEKIGHDTYRFGVGQLPTP